MTNAEGSRSRRKGARRAMGALVVLAVIGLVVLVFVVDQPDGAHCEGGGVELQRRREPV